MQQRPWHRFYESGVHASLQYDDLTIPQLFERTVARYSGRPALIFRNEELTYREFKDHVDRLSTALASRGVEKGSRVAIHMPNLPHTVIAFFATVRLGAIAVMTNPLYTEREIIHQWNDAGATVALTMDYLYKQRLESIRDELEIAHYIVGSIPEYLRFPLTVFSPRRLRRRNPPLIAEFQESDRVHRFRNLVESTPPAPPDVEIAGDDVAMLQYTGGTTGVSKGAMLTHRNVSVNAQQCRAWNTGMRDGQEMLLGILPYFHIYGLTASMVVPVMAGATIVLQSDPRDIAGLIKNVVKHRVTMCPLVPAMYVGINEYPGVDRYDLSSIKVCNSGSAPLAVEALHRFEKLTGAKISEGYGLTETSPVTHSNPFFGERKVGSIGVPIPDTDAKIVDMDTGLYEVPVGEDGELVLRGPQVMKGYWNMPAETNKVLKDGWLYTGDLARMDEDGYFYVVGRKKDMILCSGYNVYPDEIDRVLMGHPDIIEAATIGLPDPKRGETVKSFVVRRNPKLTADEVIEYARENLAAYKVPREVEFRESLPKSTVLKILRRQLRDEEMAKRGPAEGGGATEGAEGHGTG
jgi:long-chain acyl-CoA synthetase